MRKTRHGDFYLVLDTLLRDAVVIVIPTYGLENWVLRWRRLQYRKASRPYRREPHLRPCEENIH